MSSEPDLQQPKPAQAIGLLVAGSLCLLPFLIPIHQQPLLSFYPEWLAGALLVGAASSMLLARSAASWPVPSRWLAAFALLLVLTSVLGRPLYPQVPLIAAFYVLAALLALWLGSQLGTTLGIDTAALTLAAFIL